MVVANEFPVILKGLSIKMKDEKVVNSLSGRIDLILIDPNTNEVVLLDVKTSLHHKQNMIDTSTSRSTAIQLEIYASILEALAIECDCPDFRVSYLLCLGWSDGTGDKDNLGKCELVKHYRNPVKYMTDSESNIYLSPIFTEKNFRNQQTLHLLFDKWNPAKTTTTTGQGNALETINDEKDEQRKTDISRRYSSR